LHVKCGSLIYTKLALWLIFNPFTDVSQLSPIYISVSLSLSGNGLVRLQRRDPPGVITALLQYAAHFQLLMHTDLLLPDHPLRRKRLGKKLVG
jgi:hypothetical protein